MYEDNFHGSIGLFWEFLKMSELKLITLISSFIFVEDFHFDYIDNHSSDDVITQKHVLYVFLYPRIHLSRLESAMDTMRSDQSNLQIVT